MTHDISVHNLSKTFLVKEKHHLKKVHAVQSVSFQINRGSCVAFIGPNGAGKSTTIKMLTSILHPTSGEVEILGLNPWKERKKLLHKIGAVFGQRSQLWYHLPAKDSFNLLTAIYDIPTHQAQIWTQKLIQLFKLETLVNKPVRQLSLGERMRCEIVASLLHQPDVLFLDEPTIGLDVEAKALIRELLSEQIKQNGTTVLMTSHDTGDIEQLCKRVLLINHGQLILDTTVADMKRKYIPGKEITLIYTDGTQNSFRLPIGHALNEELSQFIQGKPIQDISISETSLEDIIRILYQRDLVK